MTAFIHVLPYILYGWAAAALFRIVVLKDGFMGFIGSKRVNDPTDSEYEPHGNYCEKGCGGTWRHPEPCRTPSTEEQPYRTAAPGAPTPSKQAFLKFTCSKIESRIEGVFIVTFTCDESAFPKVSGGSFSNRELVVELNVPPPYAVGRTYYLALPEPL